MLTMNFMPPPQSRRSGSGMVAQCRRRSERNRAGTRRIRPVRLRFETGRRSVLNARAAAWRGAGGIEGTEALKALEWLHSADQRLFAAWPIDADPALTEKEWASPETAVTTENPAPSRESNRADPRF